MPQPLSALAARPSVATVTPEGASASTGLVKLGGKTLDSRDVIPLGDAVIHSVTNPIEQITAAIHVYGGDFFAVPRSEWDPITLEERPYDMAHALRVFEESNERLREKAAD